MVLFSLLKVIILFGCFQASNCNNLYNPWKAWSGWSLPSVTCGTLISNRARECKYVIPFIECEGNSTETKIKLIPCPIDGGWAEWGEWSQVKNVKSRHRSCTNPVPEYDGHFCNGKADDVIYLGKWDAWSEWSEFDDDCGQQTRERDRKCTKTDPIQICEGLSSQKQSKFKVCKNAINGQWGSWLSWSGNNEHGRTRKRHRMCDQPAPKNGGLPCHGSSVDVEKLTTAYNNNNGKAGVFLATQKTVYVDQIVRKFTSTHRHGCLLQCQHAKTCLEAVYVVTTKGRVCYFLRTNKVYPTWMNRHRKKLSTKLPVFEKIFK